MHIKGIYIKGFKSFPDPITIWFDQHCTAVVGPNGSGKSNLLDAIRWVLGEQSPNTLRGSKMEDLIFSGSSQRKGKVVAEVTLILDNSRGYVALPGDVVRLGRRVHKDLGSTYLLNDTPCRLKDVESVLLQAGIGKDSSSIVGQGRIDTLLMSKASDRRQLFEEAAGIIKYKRRKKEAVGKLEHTGHQLQRIQDIIHELNRQARPLKGQAQKAKKYKEVETRLETLEINLMFHKWQQGKKEYDSLKKTREEAGIALEESRQQLETREMEVRQQKKESQLLDRSIEEDQKAVYRLGSKLEMLGTKIEVNKEKIRGLQAQKQDKEEKGRKLMRNQKELQEEMREVQQRLDEVTKKIDGFMAQRASLTRADEAWQEKWSALQKEEENLGQSMSDIIRKRQDLVAKLQYLEGERTRLETRLQEILSLQEETKEQKRREETHIQGRERELEQQKREWKQKNIQLEQCRAREKDAQKTQKDLQEKKLSTEERLNKFINRKQQQEKNTRHHSAYAIIEASKEDRLSGIIGLVENLYSVDREYEMALETAIEGRRQNIVVKDEAAARRAIGYLKEHAIGRATFLALDMLSPRTLRQKEEFLLSVDGILGRALDFLHVQGPYEQVFAHILGRVLLAETLSVATKASRLCQHSLPIVSLGGDIVYSGGAMAGGFRNKANRMHGVQKELLKIEEELKEIKICIQTTEELLAKEEEDRHRLQEESHSIKLAIKGTEHTLTLLREGRDQLEAKARELNGKEKTVQKDLHSLKASIEEIKRSVELLDDDYQEKKEEGDTLEKALEELRHEMGDGQTTLINVRIELTGQTQEQDLLEQQLQRLKKDFQNLREDYEENEKNIARDKNLVQQLDGDRLAMYKDREHMEEEKVVKEQQLKEMRQERTTIEEKSNMLEHAIQTAQQRVKERETHLHELMVTETRVLGEMERTEERLYREYGCTMDSIKPQEEKSIPQDKVEEEIEDLKRQKASLEPVHMGAIEEYEELNRRRSFLKEQYKDLQQARVSLETVIQGIDKTMAQRFLATYKKVAREFSSIFAKLFEGGSAQLALSQEDDLLETGVEVIVQPPGKKLQKLSLLSGGEKALTAIALIFALMRVKPCPFYVLDEIDASLDDANVERFASFLKDSTDLSQFILITHRKGTIAGADAMYGITMEEEGVSKVVSYRLKEQAS